jgi:hypothetical protein
MTTASLRIATIVGLPGAVGRWEWTNVQAITESAER